MRRKIAAHPITARFGIVDVECKFEENERLSFWKAGADIPRFAHPGHARGMCAFLKKPGIRSPEISWPVLERL